jgi:hypothetical protein
MDNFNRSSYYCKFDDLSDLQKHSKTLDRILDKIEIVKNIRKQPGRQVFLHARKMTMDSKLILGLIITSTLTMCSDKPKSTEQIESKVTKTESFKSVYDTLDQMEIPVTLTWDKWDHLCKEHFERYGLRQGENVTDHPYAKLAESENFKAFVFISIDETGSPVIMTFDKNGNELDGLDLMGDVGSNDPSIRTTELAIINKDLTIQLIDSTWTYDVNADGNRIESSEKLATKDELFRILVSGEIEKIR